VAVACAQAVLCPESLVLTLGAGELFVPVAVHMVVDEVVVDALVSEVAVAEVSTVEMSVSDAVAVVAEVLASAADESGQHTLSAHRIHHAAEPLKLRDLVFQMVTGYCCDPMQEGHPPQDQLAGHL